MCGFLRAWVARLVSVEMQGKLDILAENAREDGFVAGVCLLQDGYAGNGGFLQDRFGEGPCFFARRLRWGALRGGVRLWRHPTPKRCDCWGTASVESAP